MKTPLAINITDPCHQDWTQMTAGGAGKFCTQCSKTVVDFTIMSDTALLNYIQKNGFGCGRLYKDQLNRLIVPVGNAPKYPGYKKWVVSLLLIAGWVKEGNAQIKAPLKDTITQTQFPDSNSGRVALTFDSVGQGGIFSVVSSEQARRLNLHGEIMTGPISPVDVFITPLPDVANVSQFRLNGKKAVVLSRKRKHRE